MRSQTEGIHSWNEMFNEFSKRNEKSLFNLQTSIIQASSCFVDLLSDTVEAEEKSKVVDTRVLLRNCLDGMTFWDMPIEQSQTCERETLRVHLTQNIKPSAIRTDQLRSTCLGMIWIKE